MWAYDGQDCLNQYRVPKYHLLVKAVAGLSIKLIISNTDCWKGSIYLDLNTNSKFGWFEFSVS